MDAMDAIWELDNLLIELGDGDDGACGALGAAVEGGGWAEAQEGLEATQTAQQPCDEEEHAWDAVDSAPALKESDACEGEAASSVLLKRNRELEQETELLRLRAVDLRSEIDALRYAGVLDLDKENRLLRLEVKRHRTIIECIVKEAQGGDMGPEERYRLAKSAMETARYHVLGLAYSHPTWKLSPSKFAGDGFPEIAAVKYEYRPAGVPRKQATHLNVRLEWSFGVSPSEYFRRKGFQPTGVETTQYGSRVERREITPPEFAQIAAKIGEEEGGTMRVYHKVETQGTQRRENNFAIMKSRADVCLPAVFPELSRNRGLEDGHVAPAYVRCDSNLSHADPACAASLFAWDAGKRRELAHRVQGLLVCADPSDPDTSWLVNLNSIPAEDDLFGLHISEVFDEDTGRMHPNAQADINRIRRRVVDLFDLASPPT